MHVAREVMDVELSGSLVNNRYKVEKKIQSGFYGTTWLAVDQVNQSDVCLKVKILILARVVNKQ